MARDLAEGKITSDQLEGYADQCCRDVVGIVVGPDDVLWPLQVEICRAVLAARGLSPDELVEWLAVARHGTDEPEPDAGPGPETDETDAEPEATAETGTQ